MFLFDKIYGLLYILQRDDGNKFNVNLTFDSADKDFNSIQELQKKFMQIKVAL